jgi:glycosyltransferase 2 family protein
VSHPSRGRPVRHCPPGPGARALSPDGLERQTSRRAGRLGKFLRVSVSVALLLLLAWIVDLEELAAVLLGADARLLGLALLVALADRALMIGKWYPLLRAQGLEIPLAHAASAYLAASFASMFLPASIGGDVLRTIALGGPRRAMMEVGASILLERMLGLAASAALCMLALVLALAESLPLAFLMPWVLAAAAAPVGIALLALWPGGRRWPERYREHRWFGLAQRFALACVLYRHRPGTLAAVGLLSLVEQTFPIVIYWILGHALGLEVPLLALVIAVPLTLLVGRLPIAVAGIGVIEGAMVYLLGLLGIAPPEALSVALAGRLVEIAVSLPGALFWSSLAPRREPDPP